MSLNILIPGRQTPRRAGFFLSTARFDLLQVRHGDTPGLEADWKER